MALKGRNMQEVYHTLYCISFYLIISAVVDICMVTGVFRKFQAKRYASHFVKLSQHGELCIEHGGSHVEECW